jgi:hypothetical protein
VVFDCFSECFSTDDVLAARTCARTLLVDSDGPPGLLSQARFVLTAACLHIHARVGPDPTIGDLRDLLAGLRDGAIAWRALAASPIQFVRYAAAELADADGALGSAMELALRALNTDTPQNDL